MAAVLTLGRGESRHVERWIARLADRYPLAEMRALNRAGTTMRAVMARGISKNVGLPVATVRAQLRLEPAAKDKPVVRLTVSGRRLPLIEFNAKGPWPSRGRGRGVTARLLGGAGRYPNAFIAYVGSGRHKGVFIRGANLVRTSRGAWGKNLPIKELRGPSLPRVFEVVSPEAQAAGQASLTKNLSHELRFALGGASQS